MEKQTNLKDMIETLESRGRYAFSLTSVRCMIPDLSESAIKSALSRLSKKGDIVSVYKGYYLIITPQYKSKGILPPYLYLDGLMNKLGRSYYLGLLNAAVYHKASHQQPQEFFVFIELPALRTTFKKGLKVNYINKTEIPENLLETRKTDAGFLKISNPILTAVDLVQFEKRIGGLNRVATVLNELIESLSPTDFNEVLINHANRTVLQRLGYLLDKILDSKILADALYNQLKKQKLYRTPLKPTKKTNGFPIDDRWHVIINAKIEMDE